jgi:N-acetylglucosamine-6-phosphate deacetylase
VARVGDGGPIGIVRGRLVIDDAIVPGRLHVEAGRINAIEPDDAEAGGPIVAPGFVDLHVHGWGGHDAMGPASDLDGMARVLLRHGVTSFLPTAVTAPLPTLAMFAGTVRGWIPAAPGDGADPLGFNLEGPFISPARKGAHNPRFIVAPADVPRDDLEPLLDGLRLITVAPELPGAIELIARLRVRDVVCSLGHSAATVEEARAGYASGAMTTTHLFNAMSGVDHHHPGLAVAALTDDGACVELIADGQHVDPSLWPLIRRAKPPDRLLLVSDAVPLAGMGDGRATMGGLEVEVRGDRCTLVAGGALAGSVIALDSAVRNLAREGWPLPEAVAAASANPAALLGLGDRGRIAVGLRADLVELDDLLRVRRVTRGEDWIDAA